MIFPLALRIFFFKGYGIFGNSFRGSSTGLFGTGSMSEFGGGGGSSLFGGGGSMTSMPGFSGGSSTALGGSGSMTGGMLNFI